MEPEIEGIWERKGGSSLVFSSYLHSTIPRRKGKTKSEEEKILTQVHHLK